MPTWKQKITEIDFSQLIKDIMTHDEWTHAKIGVVIGCSQSMVCEMKNKNRGEPRFTVGYKIIKLHKGVCENAYTKHVKNIQSICGYQL